jgi:hypothetical protein
MVSPPTSGSTCAASRKIAGGADIKENLEYD